MNSGKFKSLNQLSFFITLAVTLFLLTTIACNQTKTQSTNSAKPKSNQLVLADEIQPPASKQISTPPPYTKVPSNRIQAISATRNQNPSKRKFEESKGKLQIEEMIVEDEKIIMIQEVVEELEETIEVEVIANQFMAQEPEIFHIVEVMPSFPGGEKALLNHIATNIKYPIIAKENNIQGNCIVSFTVNEDGSLSDIHALRDIGGGTAEEVERIMKNMPKWIPGEQRGKAIKVSYKLPIRFQLDAKLPDTQAVNSNNFNTEDYDPIVENDFLNTTAEPVSTFSIDVDAAAYANVRRMINYGQKPQRSAVRIEEMINYFNYDYPQPKGDDPFEVITELSECPWNKNHQLLHIGLQGLDVDVSQLPYSNLVFLIDVSGSMNSPNKLPLLVESFKLLTNKLRQDDQVAIVVYAGSSGVVLPSTNGTEKETILNALNRLRAGGGTAGAEGIELAYKIAKENYVEGGNNRVILATDGDFNIGTSSDGGLVNLIERKREEGVFLSVLGFGMGNYKDNKMQKLANKGNGNHYYIDGLLEAKKVLVNEFGGTLFTIAEDVKLQLEFNPAKVAGYRLIGYENRMLETEDFNDDKKDAGELGSGHTVTALYEIIPANADSKYLVKTDPLKYQSKKKLNPSNELLTVKLRYKKPDGDKSQLIEIPVLEERLALNKTSEAYKFAASVAEFGLLLKSSAYKENASFESVINFSKAGMGKDAFGYRAEFISLVKKVQNM